MNNLQIVELKPYNLIYEYLCKILQQSYDYLSIDPSSVLVNNE